MMMGGGLDAASRFGKEKSFMTLLHFIDLIFLNIVFVLKTCEVYSFIIINSYFYVG